MTTAQQAASTAKDEAGATAQTAADQASQVAGAATSAATDVASTTKEQAGNVIGEGLDQARELLETVRTQVGEQAGTQSDKLAGSLRDVGTQLRDGDTSGTVGSVLQELGERAHGFADYLERTGPEGVLTDVRRYAARNPGTFAFGAAVAGLVAGRLAKGLSGGSSTPAAPAVPQPVPATPAAYAPVDEAYAAPYTTTPAATAAELFPAGADPLTAPIPGVR